MEKQVKIYEKEELTQADKLILNEKQLDFILSKTPANHVYTRPAKGGGQWNYVTGAYIKKVLNFMFGWDWDFIVEKFDLNMDAKQAIVLGKLVCRTSDKTIIKQQFGRQEIKFKKNSTEPLDVGNDLKGATTDALKKCASELGIASDIYAGEEFKEVKVKQQGEKSDFETIRDKVIEALDNYQGDDKQEIQQMCADKRQNKEETIDFYQNILKSLTNEVS